MKKKTTTLTTTLIIILVIIVGGIFGYLYTQDKKYEINPTEEKKEQEEEIQLDSDEVQKALNNFNKVSAVDKYNSFNVSSLDTYGLILTAINGLDNDQITWCISSEKQITASITIDELNVALNSTIKDKTISIQDIIDNSRDTSLTVGQYGYDMFTISVDGDAIHIIGGCDGKGPGSEEDTILGNAIKATTKGNELYVYTKVAYGRINRSTDDIKYDYYKDDSRSGEPVETVSLSDNLTWDKYETYKQIYKKIDDNYYFVSSKKER